MLDELELLRLLSEDAELLELMLDDDMLLLEEVEPDELDEL